MLTMFDVVCQLADDVYEKKYIFSHFSRILPLQVRQSLFTITLSLVAICWERLSRQLFTVLFFNAVLVVLVPLSFCVWAGCGNRLYRLLIIVFLSTFHSQPKIRAAASFWKVVQAWDTESVPRVPKARDGKSTTGRCPPLESGVRENVMFRKAVDAFLLHL